MAESGQFVVPEFNDSNVTAAFEVIRAAIASLPDKGTVASINSDIAAVAAKLGSLSV